MKSNIHILITGNHSVVVKGFALMLNSPRYVTSEVPGNSLSLHQPDAINPPQTILVTSLAGNTSTIETVLQVKNLYPAVPVIVTTLDDDIQAIIGALKAGVRGIVLTSIDPKELALAIKTVTNDGYFFDLTRERLIYTDKYDIKDPQKKLALQNLPASDTMLLQLLCSNQSYEEMAVSMQVTPQTIKIYRERLSKVLGIKSRVGLALYAIVNGLNATE